MDQIYSFSPLRATVLTEDGRALGVKTVALSFPISLGFSSAKQNFFLILPLSYGEPKHRHFGL